MNRSNAKSNMRELRKDIDSRLEPSKEELDHNIDEMKIEDVLIGLKGLKQEEVFSFLGKNNFTPTETEEWLKIMSSTGFSGFDQLGTVDSTDMEPLQLSFGAQFDPLQSSNGHTLQNSSTVKSDAKFKIKTECNLPTSKTVTNAANAFGWSTKKIKYEDAQHQRTTSMWPNLPGTQPYSLDDYHVENFREEEIIATSIGEELISTSNADDEDELNFAPNNTYVIQSSGDVVDVPDKPKPIKLLIKRVESEDETSGSMNEVESPATRSRSKRVWHPSSKRKLDESAPVRKRRCTRKAAQKSKDKNETTVSTRKKAESLEELDFPFSNTVHQDDDFVYPSLEMSDEEEDNVYSFSQRDDETWTPKIKMKINEVKTERPTRNRKRNSAVAKCLEAAALKRAEPGISHKSDYIKREIKKSSSKVPSTSKCTFDANVADQHDFLYSVDALNSVIDNSPSLPSTSSALHMSSLSSSFTATSTGSDLSVVQSSSSETSMPSPSKRKGRKKGKSIPKTNKLSIKTEHRGSRLIPPKTCKLIQNPGEPVVASPHPCVTPKRSSKTESNNSNSTSHSAGNSDKKLPASTYITKRGKPKKGMATAKQRLGKILKMHKMFF